MQKEGKIKVYILIRLLLTLILIFFLAYYIFGYFDIIKARELSVGQREIIKKHGISHRTTESGYNGIKKDKVIYGSKFRKAYSNHFRKCVFFFAEGYKNNSNISFNVTNKLRYEIIIKDLTEEQINKLKIRTYDNTIMFQGDFELLINNKVEWHELPFSSNNGFCSIISDLKSQVMGPYNKRLLLSVLISFCLVIIAEIILKIFINKI